MSDAEPRPAADPKLCPDPHRKEGVHVDQIYNWLTRRHVHQDQLRWSRTQTIVTIEAAIIASAFYLQGWWACIPVATGNLVIVVFWKIVLRDWQLRDHHGDWLNHIHEAHSLPPDDNIEPGYVDSAEVTTHASPLCRAWK